MFKKTVLTTFIFVGLVFANNLLAAEIQRGNKIEGTIRASVGCNIIVEKKSEMKFFLDTGQKMIPLDSPPAARVGQKVSVEGRWADDDKKFLCRIVKPLEEKKKTDTSDTIGEKKLLVLPMKFSDENYGRYPNGIESRIFDDLDSLDAFYQEVSYGKLYLSGDVENERTMTNPSTSYELDGWDILSQITPDVISGISNETLKQYDGIVILLATNKMNGYSWGTVGKWGFTKDGEEISLSVTLTQPDTLTADYIYILWHEYGHNLGHRHSGSWNPSKNEGGCIDIELISDIKEQLLLRSYGDRWNIMGGWTAGIDCQRRKDAGWISESQSVTVRSDTTIELDQRELESDGIKLITIPCGYNEGEEVFYFIEYFKASLSKFDSESTDKRYVPINSIVLRFWTGVSIGDYGNKSVALVNEGEDGVRDASNYFDDDGGTFCDSARGVKVEFLGTSGEGADSKAQVKVTFTCPEEIAPTVSLSDLELTNIIAGEVAEYQVTVSNNCEIGCGTRTYNLAGTILDRIGTTTGWIAQFDQNPIEVGAYGTATATLKVTAPPNASPDIYTLKVSAVDEDNESIIGSAETFVSAECRRENPLLSISSSLSPAQEAISPGDKVTYWISVNNPEVPGCERRNYIVSAVLPMGWTANPMQAVVSVEAGYSGAVQFEVGCPEESVDGNYQISFRTSDQDNPLIGGEAKTEVTVSTPTPIPTPTEPAAATVEKLEIYSENLQKKIIVLHQGETGTITVTALASSGFPAPKVQIMAQEKTKKVKVTETALSDAKGQAVFTVTARKKGRCNLFFTAQSVKKRVRVKIE